MAARYRPASLSSRVFKYATHLSYEGDFSWQRLRRCGSHLCPRSRGVLHHRLGVGMKSRLTRLYRGDSSLAVPGTRCRLHGARLPMGCGTAGIKPKRFGWPCRGTQSDAVDGLVSAWQALCWWLGSQGAGSRALRTTRYSIWCLKQVMVCCQRNQPCDICASRSSVSVLFL